ncbi:MAG TPA: PilZ domain-containing protein [Sphingobium sp.]|uniref:PilZ domain-containing protein n=1 Tax=Sphingobium sp. TaxID=1912891 RepID=UPI002ED1691D
MSEPTDDAVPTSRAKRDSLFLLTELHEEGGGGRLIGPVRVRNLSATGLMAECERPLQEGDRVAFALRGVGELRASVAWWRGGRVGLAFDVEIDPMVVRRTPPSGNTTILEPYKLPRFKIAGPRFR